MIPLKWLLWLVLGVALLTACGEREPFQGTEIRSEPSPDFQLTDQNNQTVSLSDFRGKVVGLTFVYTSCPDVCPVVTETIRRAFDALGEDNEEVQFLAVSVDPERDNMETAEAYSEERGMKDRWHFLVGTKEDLEPVWKSYWLDPINHGSLETKAEHTHENGDVHLHDVPGGELAGLSSTSRKEAQQGEGGHLVSHSAPIFLIDRDGNRRVLLNHLDLDPAPLVHDLRLLMNE